MAYFQVGQRVHVRCKAWGSDQIEIEMPCCPGRKGRVYRADYRANNGRFPRGGFVTCPACDWTFEICEPTECRSLAVVTLEV